MASSRSASFKRVLNATSASEAPRWLLEISHDALAEPARVVDDTEDFPYASSFAFEAGATYALNQIVVPSVYNGRYYKTTVAGIAAGAEPTWPTTLTDTVVSGAATLRCEGYQYKATEFKFRPPGQRDKQQPRAQLSLDNVGRELAAWLEESNGGQGATVRVMQMLRSDPATIEWEITMDLRNLAMNWQEITGDLGFDDILNRPGVTLTYRPDVAPGLF